MTVVTGDATVADQERRAPGRPRSARADEAIVEAVLDMLADGQSVEALSIEAIAARAGVGKATIYRRWANKEALIVDAVSAIKGPLPTPRGESVREDLVMLLNHMRKRVGDRSGRVFNCLIPQIQRSAEMHRLHQAIVEPRRAVLRQVLQRGIETGELRADLDVEMALLMLCSPSMIQGMLRWNPAVEDERIAERIVDMLLAGIAA